MTSDNKKRIIVVLGMHRSGTSSVTRALVAIGARVSERLLPPGADNPRGFWEDQDFVEFNERLLARLDASYDSLALLPDGFEQRSDLQEMLLEAVVLLRDKLADNGIFALKDPRTCRLLPFWQRVFAHLEVDVDHVIAVRNPLSVAHSLTRRNGFEQRKSFWLWLQHYVAALQGTHGLSRVFIDYDRLMAAPEEQLRRLAGALHLPGEDAAIHEYCAAFLSRELRHAAFTFDDLLLVPHLPEPLIRAGRLLQDATTVGEAADFPAAWTDLAAELRRQGAMLEFLQTYDRQLQALQQERLAQEQALARLHEERAADAARFAAQHAETVAQYQMQHEEAVARYQAQHAETVAQYQAQDEETVARYQAQHEETVARYQAQHTETVAQYQAQYEEASARFAAELAQVRQHGAQELALLGSQLEQARSELQRVYASRSMRLTAPLRWLNARLPRRPLLLARGRQLLERARFVWRQEGGIAVCRRTLGFIGRGLRRRLALQRLARQAMPAMPVATPLVSFIIPIYDRTDVLREAIRSALAQTLPVFEVILVTDGSPPATLAVVEEFRHDPRVRIFGYPTSSGNAVRGRNKGILEARGRYIAFLDSDDIAAPDRLEVCLPLLESGEADVVYGAWRAKLDGTRQIDGLSDGQVVYSPDCDLELLRKVCVPCQSTVMVRRECLLEAGFLKPRMEYREDHELWARLAYRGARFKAIEHVLTDLRLHAGNNELNFKGDDAHWERLFAEEYRLPGPRPRKIAFLMGCLGISGGAAVVLRHVAMLLDAGHDAFVINLSGEGDAAWFGNLAIRVYGPGQLEQCGLDNIDLLFATFWTTVEWLERIPARRKLYFVQSDERLFYDEPAVQAQVAATYRGDYEYVGIAGWICDMLRGEFARRQVHLVPNGLDLQLFHPGEPLQAKPAQRLRVLIEGPISVPFKGVADAWAAVESLDCELWIVSSSGRPEPHWRYDRFFEGVGHADMRRIYASCDILLKMSRVESFAYPPLEAMACGCSVVLGEVRGGIEYAEHEVNVLKVPAGDIAAARAAVQRLIDDAGLRGRLREAGLATAAAWSWDASREAMMRLLDGELAGRQPAGRVAQAQPHD